MPLISIIVPVYNVEKYLDKCVQSLLNQTYKNIEIILVDDGSPDNCGKMCDEYAEKNARVEVIHKKNGGLADARNVAIDVAIGEWIVFVDSDDFVEPDYVENLYKLTQKFDCKLACSRFRYVFEGQEVDAFMNVPQEIECCYDKMNALERLFLQEDIGNEAWGKIYHKSLFESGIRYPYGLIYEDLPTTYLFFLQCDKIGYSTKKTYNYLMRSTSIEGAKFNKRKSESAVKIIQSIQDHYNELMPILFAVKSRLFGFAMHVLLAMPKDYSGKDKDFLIDYVKRNRVEMILKKKIPLRVRLAALLTFGGLPLCKTVFAKMKGNITLQRSETNSKKSN